MASVPPPKIGDHYLLFHNLPYDFSADLPLALGGGVCLEYTPQQWLEAAEDGLAAYLIPGYGLPGMGLNNCCLRGYASSGPGINVTPVDLLFLSLIALRLHEPTAMQIAGQFRLGRDEDRLLEPTLYQLSASVPARGLPYKPSDIAIAAAIADRMLAIDRNDFRRLQTALIFFGQVTLGVSKSFQLSHLGLFAALEALFVPSGNKAAGLSRRVSRFLEGFQAPDGTEAWVKREYVNGRNRLAHGVHGATFGTRLEPSNREAFVKLHEIVRFCLLGFLSLDDQMLRTLTLSSGTVLQRALDDMGSAMGPFVQGRVARFDE